MSYSQGDEIEYGVVSDCCGAEVIYQDICSDCKEHCDPISDEEDDDELTPEQMNDELRSIGF
jgi:hypothetical protein